MTLDELKALAEEALELDAKATKGPWEGDQDRIESSEVGDIARMLSDTLSYEQDAVNAALIASYRTAAPKLARAVMALLPHVRHYYNDENGEGCAHYIDEREPCTCGLDAALAALDEGEKGTI